MFGDLPARKYSVSASGAKGKMSAMAFQRSEGQDNFFKRVVAVVLGAVRRLYLLWILLYKSMISSYLGQFYTFTHIGAAFSTLLISRLHPPEHCPSYPLIFPVRLSYNYKGKKRPGRILQGG
jgi:hypothetical protein